MKYLLMLVIPILIYPQSSYSSKKTESIALHLGTGYTVFNEEVANEEGFGNHSVPLTFRVDYFIKRGMLFSGAFLLDLPKDEDPFSEYLDTGVSGESDIALIRLALSGGLSSELFIKKGKSNPPISGRVFIGKDIFLRKARLIGECSDCRKETLDISTGIYLEPEVCFDFIKIGDEDGIGVAIGYKYYLGGDIKSNFLVSLYLRGEL